MPHTIKEFKELLKNPPKKRRKLDDFIITDYGLVITENKSVYYDDKLNLRNISDTVDKNKIIYQYNNDL